MIYEYRCGSCGHQFDVIKSYREIDNPETCYNCSSVDTSRLPPSRQSVDKSSAADWNVKSYQPAIGRHVSNSEMRRIAKQKGWDEVGTEPVEKIHKKFEQDREKAQADGWDKTLSTDLGKVS